MISLCLQRYTRNLFTSRHPCCSFAYECEINQARTAALNKPGPHSDLSLLYKAQRKLDFLARAAGSLTGVVVCTWLALHFELNLASSGLLDLFLVVLVAVYAGFWEATIASLAAVLSLNYFFCAAAS
jgi:K+-sensing histidine kinase KdpD